jgi:RNA polymerase sigma-70 factor, ECF subfamily
LKDEWQTIERVLSGEVAAFEELVHTYKSHVFKIVAHMVSSQEVEEVAHEVFIRAYKDLAGYRRKAPFQHWLTRIAQRTSYDYWRRQKRQRVIPVSDHDLRALEAAASGLQQFEDAAIQRAKELLDWALESLDPEDRLAFSLLYLEDMSMQEVGKILGWSLAKVKIRSFRARRVLRSLLKSKLGA